MWDTETSGGYDGLTPTGPNLNQGAESTLALISTLQHAPRPAGSGVGLDAGQRPELVNRLSNSSSRIVAMLAPTSAYPYGSTRWSPWIMLPHEYTTFGHVARPARRRAG